MIWLYRLVIYPLLDLGFWLAGFVNAKIRQGLKMRDGDPWLKFPMATKPIWIHCSSGEFEYAKPVIARLKEKFPSTKILVTYFSPSIEKAVKSHKLVDYACPLPWDRVSVLKIFLAHHQPRMLLIARTDAWPEMVYQCHVAGLPTLMFSATLAAKSSRMRFPARLLTGWTLSKLTAIHCVAQDDLDCFKELGITTASIRGDTRFDQVIARLKNPKPIKHALLTSPGSLVFVAGSTWPEDEAELLPLIQLAKQKSLNMRFVLVPHEPTSGHLEKLEAQLSTFAFKARRYSQIDAWESGGWPENSVLIVDQIGILADFYAYAQVAFVGGSFRKTVHSVMEALAAGCVTLVGPLYENNREAIAFTKIDVGSGLHAVESISSAAAGAEVLVRIRAADMASVATKIKDQVQKQAGQATDSVLNWCLNRL